MYTKEEIERAFIALIKDKDGFQQVAGHCSSGIHWTQHDMGITSNWQHDIYGSLFPDGYELVWIGGFENCEEAEKKINEMNT